MTELESIEAAVSRLSPPDFEKFRVWFEERVASTWDERIARDAESGKLDGLAQAALSAHSSGRTKPL